MKVFSFVTLLAALLIAAPAAPALPAAGDPGAQPEELMVPGLLHSVQLWRDANDVPHIFAANDRDALFTLGWVHAQDRFFQMDTLRRTFSGTLAELVGDSALSSDVQLRTLGLRRAAEASLPALTEVTQAWLSAYALGVNAYLSDPSHPLPPEYTALELTRDSIPPWTAVDSLVIGKGLAFGLSFDLSDVDYTAAYLTFQAAGAVAGFDGQALFSEDVFRSAPFDPTLSIPGAAVGAAGQAPSALSAKAAATRARLGGSRTLALLRRYRDQVARVPILERALHRRWDARGSNWWLASGAITESGRAVLANDPHLGLDTPSIFYEAQLRIRPGSRPPMNAFGVTFPGIPGIVLGCNPWICWGATVNPMDVTDVYQEELVLDAGSGLPVATRFDGASEPLELIPQSYRVNVLDGQPDDLAPANVPATDGGVTLIVPRRNHGPIVAVDLSDPAHPMGLSVQYTGWGPTRELDAFQMWNRARDLESFEDGLQYFDFGSQNFSYVDAAGNIAYFTSGEMPIREDLQNLDAPDGGVPPFLIRDGTHGLHHEWLPVEHPQPNQILPYEILPAAEMPHVINPPEGFIVSANNDPVGTTLDNNPLNQLRPGGGLFYLAPGYASGFRAGRIRRLFETALADGGKVSIDQIRSFQANNQLLDAQVLVPYIVQAFDHASEPGAPAELAAFAADPQVAEAVGRLGAWDFSTPTGIAEGFDPGDDPDALPQPGAGEVASSVAATIYSTWRGQVVRRVIDGTLAGVGLAGFQPPSSVAVADLRHLLDTFDASHGVGASGLPFFQVPGVADPAAARDVVLLGSLRSALDLLASADFAPAFGDSTNQDDYRWGRLHRIVFSHILGSPFSIPPAAGLGDLSAELPGVARSGGFGSVDAASHSARADSVNGFMFGSGPARRFVGELSAFGPAPEEVIPVGESGNLGHPFYGSELPLWLTDRYHPFPYRPADVVRSAIEYQVLVPQP